MAPLESDGKATASSLKTLLKRLPEVCDSRADIVLEFSESLAAIFPLQALQDLSLLGPTVQLGKTISSSDGDKRVLLVVAAEADLRSLFTLMAGGTLGISWPDLFGLPSADEAVLDSWVKQTGRAASWAGDVRIAGTSFKLFEVNRRSAEPVISAVEATIGEGGQNLSGRAHWFRSRSGR